MDGAELDGRTIRVNEAHDRRGGGVAAEVVVAAVVAEATAAVAIAGSPVLAASD